MRAPFAPPRLSEPRNVAADAHAVVTSWEIDNPDGDPTRFFASRKFYGNHTAEIGHLPFRNFVIRMGFQSWIMNLCDARMRF